MRLNMCSELFLEWGSGRFAKQENAAKQKPAVIPAQAGIHFDLGLETRKSRWIPAFAGMTTFFQLLAAGLEPRPKNEGRQ